MATKTALEAGYLTTQQAADARQVTPPTIRSWVRNGLDAIRIEGNGRVTLLIRRSDLQRYTPKPPGRVKKRK